MSQLEEARAAYAAAIDGLDPGTVEMLEDGEIRPETLAGSQKLRDAAAALDRVRSLERVAA